MQRNRAMLSCSGHISGMTVDGLFYTIAAVHDFDSTFSTWHHTLALYEHPVLVVEK
jgi:hypothetical protein